MAGTKPLLAQELTKFLEAAWLDLPAEAAKSLIGARNEDALRKAGWKAYDAWVSLANELTNLAYSNRVVGELTGRTMETALRLRQLGDAVASGFFGNLWPAIGLPTRSELVALRDDLLAVREELAAISDSAPLPAMSPGSADKAGDERLRRNWNSTHADGHRLMRNNTRALRSVREGNGNAAA